MKKLLILLAAVIIGAANATAFDPKDLLNGLGGGNGNNEEGSGNGSGILDAIGNMVGNATATDKFSVDDLTGSWAYTSPAVTFKSDNVAKKIGGAAAATALESKLEPYYTRLGFNKSALTVDTEHNFTLKLGMLTLKGTVEKDEDNALLFNFNAFGKVPLGKIKAKATKSMNTLNITFDATKLVDMLTKISSKVNVSTLSTLSSILNSYDGLYMGFKMKKTADK